MKLLIDASNLIAGGGKTHIVELLAHADPTFYNFSSVTVFGHKHVLEDVPERPWLQKKSPLLFRYGYVGRLIWQVLFRYPIADGVWFVPGGGSAPGHFVTMCQNLLPLERPERDRYYFSFKWLRLVLLGRIHRYAFQKAEGVIFFNHYSINVLTTEERDRIRRKAFIGHGVSDAFRRKETQAKSDSFRLIYVSTVEEYKHQWRIAEATRKLIDNGYNITIDFVGSASASALRKLEPFLNDGIRYCGSVPYAELPQRYSNADAFIFGSTCETFGMVLLEAMACGLPIICSKYSSMSETLEENALYFDPLSSEDTERVVKFAYTSPSVLKELSEKGRIHTKKFSWDDTAAKTFEFLAMCAKQRKSAGAGR